MICHKIACADTYFLFFQGTQYFKPLTFTLFGAISLVCAGLVWLLPETKGNPLQDQLLIIKPPEPVTENAANLDQEEAIPLNDIHVELENGALTT